jgi:putative hydrolase of HD superfamily
MADVRAHRPRPTGAARGPIAHAQRHVRVPKPQRRIDTHRPAAHIRAMDHAPMAGLLEFLRAAERLKTVTRSAYTSTGARETVAEHTWRVTLMAMLLAPDFPDVDVGRLVKICVVHDLGEAIGGDIPAPEQARRIEAGEAGKSESERRDLLTLVAPLPPSLRDDIVSLWDEYEDARSPEARLAKAIDKLETILQHTQGRNPPDFDYRFNLGYGREHTAAPEIIAALRGVLDDATEARAKEQDERDGRIGPSTGSTRGTGGNDE